jgi:hypothetical protein
VVLIKVELTPLPTVSRPTWKEICRHSLDTLRRCVFLDKDLVLPVTGNLGLHETLFVAASTGLEGAEIMMKRIREQLEAGAGFKAAGRLQVSATAVPLPSPEDDKALPELVQAVADRVTEMVMLAFTPKPAPPGGNEDISAAQN